MKNFKKTILITGGAGFIGSHVVSLFIRKYPDYKIINLDKLTYAGNLNNLKDIENKPNYEFVKGDILKQEDVLNASKGIDIVIHSAAVNIFENTIVYIFEIRDSKIFGDYILYTCLYYVTPLLLFSVLYSVLFYNV